jgi:hypothetical protein
MLVSDGSASGFEQSQINYLRAAIPDISGNEG